MPTIYQVSELAGVSLATVSRVMNGNKNVSEKTKKKVQDAMDELGYRPNSVAQSLASNRTNSVGLLVSELDGAFFGDMMSGVEQELRGAGKHVIITPGHGDKDRELEGIEFLISRQCDALILHVEAVSDEFVTELNRKKIPVALINHRIAEMDDNCFSVDNEQGGYLATKEMLDKGHTDIAYISGPEFKEDASLRLQGHKRALAEAGVPFNPELFFEGNYRSNGGVDGFNHLHNKNIPFTALICANDDTASGAISAAREAGIEMPEELSIVGFDNVLFAPHMHPKLTTVNNPVFEMGQMAARWVLKTIYGKSELQLQKNFEPQLIKRDSVTKPG